MNKKIILSFMSLSLLCLSSCGSTVKLYGEKEGYAYAKGHKYFDTFLGDEVPTYVDYPGYERLFTYDQQEECLFFTGCDIPITSQLYFCDIDNDGTEEICINNHRFSNNGKPFNSKLTYGYAIVDKDNSVYSGVTGTTPKYYFFFSLDENNEFIVNNIDNNGKEPKTYKTKFFFCVDGNFFDRVISGTENVD